MDMKKVLGPGLGLEPPVLVNIPACRSMDALITSCCCCSMLQRQTSSRGRSHKTLITLN